MKEVFSAQFDIEKRELEVVVKKRKELFFVVRNTICFVFGSITNKEDLSIKQGLSLSLNNSEFFKKLYLRFGLDSFNRLEGKWLLFLYDEKQNKSYLVRNHIDEYSFYYSLSNNTLLFSNQLDSITSKTGKKINYDAVDSFLNSGKIFDKTYYTGVKKIPLGSYVTIRNSIISVQRYWYPENNSDIKYKTLDDYSEHLQKILNKEIKETIGRKLPAVALSSGLDSSMIFNEILNLPINKVIALTQDPKFNIVDNQRITNEYPLVKDWLEGKNEAELVPIEGKYSLLEANSIVHKCHGEPIWGSANIIYILDYLFQAKSRGAGVYFSGFGGNFTVSWSSEGLYKNFRTNSKRQLVLNNYTLYHNLFQVIKRKQTNRLLISSIKDYKRKLLQIGKGDFGFFGNMSSCFDIDISAPLISKAVVDFCFSVPEDMFFSKQGESRQLALGYFNSYSDFKYSGKRGVQVSDIHHRFEREKNEIYQKIKQMKKESDLDNLFLLDELFVDKQSVWGDLRKFNLLWFLFKTFYS